ncbi:hypothetical protein WFJ45_22065, partial [Salmonella enterica subsp. enterica serovar Minnesota]|uniref:hypothetical protein n=1 Tax=Salmonella enterica TaxID=28901 RepID=UPI003D2B7B04
AGVESAGSLVTLYTSEFSGAPYGATSVPDYLAIATVPSFDGVGAVDDSRTSNVRSGETTIPVRTAAVTSNYFDLLRMS